MNIYQNIFPEETIALVNNQPIVIFGAPIVIQSIVRFLRALGGNILGIADNNPEKWGKTVEGVGVMQPCKALFQDKITLIASKRSFSAIGGQLSEWGLVEGKDFFSFFQLFEEKSKQHDATATVTRHFEQSFLFSELFHSHLTGSAARNIHVFYVWNTILSKHNLPIRGKKILELGFGGTLIPALMVLLGGAHHVTAVEYHELPDIYRNQQYRDMLSYLSEFGLEGRGFISQDTASLVLGDFGRLVRFTPYGIEFDRKRLTVMCPFDIAQLPDLNTDFDTIVSNVVLEHCVEPEKALEAMTRVAGPGTIALHSIDFSDHTAPDKIPEFYFCDREQYVRQNKHLNTWRLNEWLGGFARRGWEVLAVDRQEVLKHEELLPTSLNQDYRAFSMDDLATMHAIILLKFTGKTSIPL